MSAYEGSWSRIFADLAAEQAREDRALNSPANINETAQAIAEMIARAMETSAKRDGVQV